MLPSGTTLEYVRLARHEPATKSNDIFWREQVLVTKGALVAAANKYGDTPLSRARPKLRKKLEGMLCELCYVRVCCVLCEGVCCVSCVM